MQVVVPTLVAKRLTFPERVFSANVERLRQAVINGQDTHPGANYIDTTDGHKKSPRERGLVRTE